jgi:hypothetical protein
MCPINVLCFRNTALHLFCCAVLGVIQEDACIFCSAGGGVLREQLRLVMKLIYS